MHLTKQEIRLAAFSLVFDNEGKTQKYSVDQLSIATECFKLLNECVNDDEEKTYKDSEVSMGQDVKTFLLDRLNREWGVADGLFFISLKEKLETS